MQKPFKVQYAGLPDSQQTILTESERMAALQFLSHNIARNTGIAKMGVATPSLNLTATVIQSSKKSPGGHALHSSPFSIMENDPQFP